jgi:hypothetical protein
MGIFGTVRPAQDHYRCVGRTYRYLIPKYEWFQAIFILYRYQVPVFIEDGCNCTSVSVCYQ